MSRPRTNYRPGPCAKCGANVAEHAGTLTGPPWKVFCTSCLPRPAAEQPTVRVSLEGQRVTFRLGGFLGGARFAEYRAATGGCRYEAADGTRRNLCPVTDAPAVLAKLRQIDGLKLDIDDAATDALMTALDAAEAVRQDAADRMDDVDAALAERGQALYGYQRTGIPWLASRNAALLADDMGLGKTLQCLLAAPADAPILVVAPAVAKGVWVREVGKWRPDLTAVALKGRKSFRWPAAGELVVTNYEILPGKATPRGTELPEDLGPAPAGCVLIADEAHKVKSTKAAMTKKLRAVARRVRDAGGRVWLATGTPLLNRPPDLWALLVAANLQKQVAAGFPEFARAMGGWQEQIRARGGRRIYVWQWGGTPSPTIADSLRDVMLRRIKEDVLEDLPEKRVEDLDVNGLDRATKTLCDEAWNEAQGLLAGGGDLLSLPAFEEMSRARAALAASKIKAVLALADDFEEADEPVVVFSAHRAPIEALGAREGWAEITGSTPPARRTEIEEAFQRGELRGVAATIKAGGVAITLTRARRAVFVDLEWNPSLNSQAEDRIYRIGQDRGVLITRLVADHVLDQHVAALLAEKQHVQDRSVDAARRQAGEDAGAELLEAAQSALDRAASAALEGCSEEEYEARLAELEAELEEARHQNAMTERASRRGLDLEDLDLEGGHGGQAPPRRPAQTAVEDWAGSALVGLAMMDPDRAFARNDAGFNKADGSLGHLLADRARSGGLSEVEWRLAVGICKKYHRQVGECPENM